MMAAPYRKNSMMAMLDAKPEAKRGNGQSGQNNGQQFWTDVNADDQLSPLRKHLISTYLQVSDEDAMPLLSEYFGVALSFVALGALLRSSNSSKKKHKKGILTPEDERLDLQACSRFERMALESMLKESMERLGGLSQNAYQLECRVRDLVDENVARDREKVQLLKRVAEGGKVVQELKALRRAEGRANERVMSIVAAKEQDWLKEKRNLQKEIEKLKETVNGMTREAKFQARRCRNPICEHCKGIDKVVRTVKGRISLRDLHSSRESAQANGRREAPKLGHPVDTPKVERLEIDEDRVLMKAIELKKKHKEHQSKVERLHQPGDTAESGSSPPSKELLLKQQHDMESELANILKRVGMLKQKSYLTAGSSTSKEASLAMEEMHLPVDNNGALEYPKDEFSVERNQGEENTEKDPLITSEPNMDDPTLEVAESTSDQEESDLVELEKAFELDADEVSSPPQDNHLMTENAAESSSSSSSPSRDNHLATDNPAENVEAQPESHEIVNGEISSTTKEQQRAPVIGDELVQLQENLRNEDGLVSFPCIGNESNDGLDEEIENSGAVISDAVADPIGEGETSSPMQVLKEADPQEQEFPPEAATNVLQADNGMHEAGLQRDTSLDSSRPDSESTSVTEISENASAESTSESRVDSERTSVAETSETASAESINESRADSERTSVAETPETASADSTNESRPDSKCTSVAETSETASAESTNESRPDSECTSVAETSETVSAESTNEGRPDSECTSVAETSETASAESTNEDEQVVGLVEDEDIPEFADALCLPLDPETFSGSEEGLPSPSSDQPEHDHTEYDTGKDVKENWGFEDSVSCCTEGELLENEDIPVFERNDIEDDLAGELPEPEEKRVCGLETTNELLSAVKDTSHQEGSENLVQKDNAATEGVFDSQQEEGPFEEKVALLADVKQKLDAVVEQS